MLIIYAHPNKEGHCGYFLSEIEKLMKKRKIRYTLIDLYQADYDPVLKNEEHYTSGHYKVSAKNKKIQNMIQKEKKFIFIYPTWWNSPPAILMGFMERVFTSRYAFRYVNGIPIGLLKGKAAVFTTTGAKRWLAWLFSRDISLKIMTRYTLGFCGIRAKGFSIGGASKGIAGKDKFSNKQRRSLSKKAEKVNSWLL